MSVLGAKSGVTGNILSSDIYGAERTETAPFGEALIREAEANPRIVGLTADLGKYTDIHLFANRFPERFFQIGMAEQNHWCRCGSCADRIRTFRHDILRICDQARLRLHCDWGGIGMCKCQDYCRPSGLDHRLRRNTPRDRRPCSDAIHT